MRLRDEQITISQLAMRQESEEPNRKQKFINCLRKYCDATTLHGFKYLSEPNRPLYERIYWLIAIIIVYSTVAFIVIDQVEIYLEKPILITFDSKSRSVKEIPFPAVSICSDNQIHSSTINLTEAFDDFQRLSSEMRKRFEYAVYICNFNHPGEEFETFDPEFFHDMLENVFGIETCTEQVLKLKWNSITVETPCQYLQPIVTVQGACLSFNMVPYAYIFRNPTTLFRNWAEKFWTDKKKVWSPDTGYFAGGGSYPDPPPWRTTGSNGVHFGFNIETKDNEELCSRGGRGFSEPEKRVSKMDKILNNTYKLYKSFGQNSSSTRCSYDRQIIAKRPKRTIDVYVHNPAEMPSPTHALLYLEENRDTTVSVSPKLYITDESLKKWTTKERGCYFQNERFLKFFLIYTQHNCEMECKANLTLSICQCAPFYFPRKLNTSVCGSAKRQCIEKSIANSGEASSCDCLPSCSELQYEIRVNKAPRNLSLDLTHHSNETFTVLKVVFQGNYFIGIKRTVMFGFSDFVANVGGILGLFLGFSILSLLEIIYFVFFRPCTNLRQRKRIKPLPNNMRKLNYGSLVVSTKFQRGLSQYPNITLGNIRY
nr:pickpocket protein 28-like [Halyomorpha halys]